MKKIFSLIACALFATAGMAQNAKADMKMTEGKYAEALPIIEADITKVQADLKAAADKAAAKGKPFDASKFNAKFAGLYNQSAKCWAQVFTPELMHAASNEPLDTVTFIKSLDNMVEHATLSHKYDNTPNAKGVAKPKFNEDNTRIVESCTDYYFYAGYFLSNSDKRGAGKYFQKHLDLPNNPLLAAKKDELLASKKDNYQQCAYFASIINYELEDYAAVLKSVDAAMGNPEYEHDLYLMKAESALKTTNDSTAYVGVLKEAIENLEDNSRFCETLLAIYYGREDAKGAHQVVDEIIAKQGNKSANPYYMKGCVYMNIEKDFGKARECFEKALAIDPNDANTNGNMSFAYTNEARERRINGEFKMLDKANVTGAAQIAKYEEQLAEFRSYYEKALPYMEKYRELQPDRSKTWAPALQQIYFNLGRQAEADAMDEIMSANAR